MFSDNLLCEICKEFAEKVLRGYSYSDHGVFSHTVILTVRDINYFCLITSANEFMFSSLFVCLSVSNFAQKLPNGFA